MRDVCRVAEPQILGLNTAKWKKIVEEAIDNKEAVTDEMLRHYKQPEILASLKNMYSDEDGRCYCCYCETQLEIVDYPQIEHRKPKGKFPECAFDWNNLHLVCQKCNTAKRDKWDAENEILDAAVDHPIKQHLGYKAGGISGIYRETLTQRGVSTVTHADLDRKMLRKARLEVFQTTILAIQEIKEMGDDPRVHTKMSMLRDKCSGQYGSLIEWLLALHLREALPVGTREG
jgi:uncharacterized protein (TIGR02646 family)